MTTKTVTLDFGDDNIEATVTLVDEPPRGPMACPMCSEAAVSELTHVTMCSRCQDSASDCAACTPPAVTEADYQAVVNDDVSAREAGEDGWWWEDDTAARMWDFR
jgi:hypothetical protein